MIERQSIVQHNYVMVTVGYVELPDARVASCMLLRHAVLVGNNSVSRFASIELCNCSIAEYREIQGNCGKCSSLQLELP